jgi:hypothetical protein
MLPRHRRRHRRRRRRHRRRRIEWFGALLALACVLFPSRATAVLTTCVNNLSTNSSDWTTGATGNVLGSIVTPSFCFQLNFIYFFGAVSSQYDIASVVLSDQRLQVTNDGVLIDDIRFIAVPEPACGAAAIGAAACAGALSRRRVRRHP